MHGPKEMFQNEGLSNLYCQWKSEVFL